MMRKVAAFSLLLALAATSASSQQSLGQIAEKEKERRKKNKEAGKVVKVVTDSELQTAEPQAATAEGAESGGATSTSIPPSTSRAGRGSSSEFRGGDDPRAPGIPSQGSLQEKLSAFEGMKRTYAKEVAEIDAQIEKNRARLQQIEQELIAQGAAGLPTAPQADMKVHNPALVPALQKEKTDLEAKNRELEAKKESLWRDVEARARRAGIPPGNIRR